MEERSLVPGPSHGFLVRSAVPAVAAGVSRADLDGVDRRRVPDLLGGVEHRRVLRRGGRVARCLVGKLGKRAGLSGVVEAEQLRALVEGRDAVTGEELLAGNRERTVRAFDMTFSAPKSASLLWAFASERVAEVVADAHREAVEVALLFLEERAAVARGTGRRRTPPRGYERLGGGRFRAPH